MSGKDEWLFRVDDMLGSIEEIQDYTFVHDDAESLYEDKKSFRAVERNIEIIAEASKYIPEDVKADYADTQWTDIIGMRNILAHNYGRVNHEAIWGVVSARLPDLKQTLQKIKVRHK